MEVRIKGIRFSLEVDGEPQDTGIFQEIEERFIDSWFKDLKIPQLQGRTVSYFTEKGLKKFRSSLKKVVRWYDENLSVFEVVAEEVSVPVKDIVYEDEFQFAIPFSKQPKVVHKPADKFL